MSLSADDKAWIESLINSRFDEFSGVLSGLFNQVAARLPNGILYNVLVISLGFASAAIVMDIKNKDIKHISYPLAELERLLVEGAGELAVLTGGYLADYNRMYPSMGTTQLIIGLTNAQAKALLTAMFKRESSRDYSVIHEFGYLGGFGFGAGALADIGYINLEKYQQSAPEVKNGSDRAKHLAFLQDERNWDRYSYAEFMSTPAVQDHAFITLANLNIQRGFKAGALKRGDHKRLGGFAAASHLVGFSNALRYYAMNVNSDDRNGTTASEYAELGEDAIIGPPPKDWGVIPNGLPMDKRFYTRVSSGFGARVINGHRGNHTGIDFPVPVGTPIKATADGKVVFAGNYAGSCGWGVKIQHGTEFATVFCHMSRHDVRAGQWVRKGAILGRSGGAKGAQGSGRSTGPHIHYSIKLNGRAVDPAQYIQQLSGKAAFAIYPSQLPLPAHVSQ